jgi:hypothetical protein
MRLVFGIPFSPLRICYRIPCIPVIRNVFVQPFGRQFILTDALLERGIQCAEKFVVVHRPGSLLTPRNYASGLKTSESNALDLMFDALLERAAYPESRLMDETGTKAGSRLFQVMIGI